MSKTVEIERKYLVDDAVFFAFAKANSLKSSRISQGYITTDPDRTVRIRIRDTQGFITIKGCSSSDGTTRYEWEKEIPLAEAEDLLLLTNQSVTKQRYIYPVGELIWEIDIFSGKNEGLLLAEVELKHVDDTIEIPDFITDEVTGDPRYYNSYLSNNPFTNW